MKVCYFGIYKPDYSRNKLFILGLQENGVEVIECNSQKKGVSKYIDLIRKHKLLKDDYDVMLVGYPGFQAVILAKFLTKKPIVFNAFVSLYDSVVQDRKEVSRFGLRALYYWFLDKIALSVSDVVIFDTNEHIKYVSKQFGTSASKLKRVFLGTDTTIFYPRENVNQNGKFAVVFYGHLIPLQGTEYVMETAKILANHKDIFFDIIGSGNGDIPLKDLSERISKADVALGIFGNTEKTKRVIPNKVYDYVASKKPVITADTPAIRELFGDNEMFLIEAGSSQKIAKTILYIKSNPEEANVCAERAYKKFTENALLAKTGLQLKNILQELL